MAIPNKVEFVDIGENLEDPNGSIISLTSKPLDLNYITALRRAWVLEWVEDGAMVKELSEDDPVGRSLLNEVLHYSKRQLERRRSHDKECTHTGMRQKIYNGLGTILSMAAELKPLNGPGPSTRAGSGPEGFRRGALVIRYPELSLASIAAHKINSYTNASTLEEVTVAMAGTAEATGADDQHTQTPDPVIVGHTGEGDEIQLFRWASALVANLPKDVFMIPAFVDPGARIYLALHPNVTLSLDTESPQWGTWTEDSLNTGQQGIRTAGGIFINAENPSSRQIYDKPEMYWIRGNQFLNIIVGSSRSGVAAVLVWEETEALRQSSRPINGS